MSTQSLETSEARAETLGASRGRAIGALVLTLLLVGTVSLVAIVGAYGYARDYGASTLLSLGAALVVVAVFGALWMLGRRVTIDK
jgi:hypothetical protein